MLKSIVQFSPTATVTPEEAERHYSEIHIAMAQKLFMFHVDSLERYMPQRVLRQYDIAGGFNRKPPDAWRFVFLHHDSPQYMSDAWRDLTSEDHEHCLEHIRSYVVDEERTLVDRRAGQMVSAKFCFIFGRETRGDDGGLVEVIDRVVKKFRSAPGARLLIVNEVSQQRKVEARGRPGQRTMSETEPSDARAILEFYFDHWRWGERFFVEEDVRLDLLLHTGSRMMKGYHVAEEIGFDRRQPLS